MIRANTVKMVAKAIADCCGLSGRECWRDHKKEACATILAYLKAEDRPAHGEGDSAVAAEGEPMDWAQVKKGTP